MTAETLEALNAGDILEDGDRVLSVTITRDFVNPGLSNTTVKTTSRVLKAFFSIEDSHCVWDKTVKKSIYVKGRVLNLIVDEGV
jgi:hypothetical protein